MTHSFGFHEERFFPEPSWLLVLWVCFMGQRYLLPEPLHFFFSLSVLFDFLTPWVISLVRMESTFALLILASLAFCLGHDIVFKREQLPMADHWQFHTTQPRRFFVKVCWIKTSIEKRFLSVRGWSWAPPPPLQLPKHGSCEDDMREEPPARSHLCFWLLRVL